MLIETKFSFGNVFWDIYDTPVSRQIKCVTCEASGEIQVQGEKFICPKCSGQSRHPIYSGHKWVIGGSHTVRNIRADLVEHPSRRRSDYTDICYMDTDSGTGTLYDERKCFASREKAQAECDLRNTGKVFDDE